MKKLLGIVLFIAMAMDGIAQSAYLAWAAQLGSSNYSQGFCITTDSAGNIYSVGNFTGGTIDADPSPGTFLLTDTSGNYNGITYVQKVNSNGMLMWAKTFPAKATTQTVATDASGNVYFTGFFRDTVDFDPGLGVSNLMNDTASFADAFLLKMDNGGNFIWVKQFTGHWDISIGPVKTDAAGNIYLMGGFTDTADFDPGPGLFQFYSSTYSAFIEKLDANANFIWAESFGDSSYCTARAMALDNLGNIYLTGDFALTADFDPGPGYYYLSSTVGGGGGDAFIMKLDNNGAFIWADQLTGQGIQEGGSISLDNLGNVYTSGRFQDTIDLDPGPGVHPVVANGIWNDAYILKLDNNGAFIWGNGFGRYGDDFGIGILNDSFGNVYTAYRAGDSVDFDPGPASFILNNGNYGLVIQKLDANGNFIWAKGIGNLAPSSMTADPNGNLYATGYIIQNTIADFDPNAGVFPLSTTASADCFIFKWNQTNNDVWPGDADANHIVDNMDILPIGLFYGQTGSSRLITGNLWQAESFANWGISQINGADIKHADCNGDGVIDNNDTLAVNLNFNLIHAITTHHNNDAKLIAPDLYFITSGTSYNAGDIVDVELWAGNSITPVSNLYGLAFNINYTASLVQQGTENISYPASWLGTPGTDAIKISKVDALGVTAYGAETRINHTNASGYGKIADFRFQLSSSISSTSFLNLSVSNYVANDSAGVPVVFNIINDSLTINAGSAGISDINNNRMEIYPNPFTNQLTIESKINNIESIKVTNVLGCEVLRKTVDDKKIIIDLSKEFKGIYFVEVETERGMVREKVIKN